MDFLSTGSVADLLGVQTHRIDYPLRDHQIRPRKGPTGAFMWRYDDVVALATLMGITPPSEIAFRDAATSAGQYGPPETRGR